jgi:hypothetical protein
MECKICNKNKNICKFRKNRKTCVKCEYTTRKTYLQKYKKDNRNKINEHNRIYQKSKNWYYVPKPKKPKIIIDKNRVRTLSEKDIDMIFNFDFLL